MKRKSLRGALLLASLATLGCDAVTVLQLDLANDPLGAVPPPAQETGVFAASEGRNASVRVATLPAGGGDTGNWVRLTRGPNLPGGQPADLPMLRGRFSGGQGDGRYLTTMRLYVPSGAGVASISFEPAFGPELASLFHVDLMPNGQVRLNDDPAQTFGSFPHDQVFSLAVNLIITATETKATVTLLGAASGALDVPIPAGPFVHQLAAVRLWIGFPHAGSFFADDLTTLRSPP